MIAQLFYNSRGCFQKLVRLFFIQERAFLYQMTTISETCFSLFLFSIYLCYAGKLRYLLVRIKRLENT